VRRGDQPLILAAASVGIVFRSSSITLICTPAERFHEQITMHKNTFLAKVRIVMPVAPTIDSSQIETSYSTAADGGVWRGSNG